MNQIEDRPAAEQKQPQTDAYGSLSIAFPIIGFVIAYCAAHSGRASGEGLQDAFTGLRGAFTGFALWLAASLLGVICAFVSLRQNGPRASSLFGIVFCSVPFAYLLYFVAINSK